MYNTCYIGNHSKRKKRFTQLKIKFWAATSQQRVNISAHTVRRRLKHSKIWHLLGKKSEIYQFDTALVCSRNSNEKITVYDTIYFKFFLHWRHWQRIAYRSYRSLRIANWIGSYQIVPGHTRSNRIVVLWIFWGIKSYLTFLQFSIFEVNQSKCSTRNAKNN